MLYNSQIGIIFFKITFSAIVSPFFGIDKGQILQEKRLFSETPIKAKLCKGLITKYCYLAQTGDALSRTEATDLFFAVTKLFQAKDLQLRRMMFLLLKELIPISDNVIIMTSSLLKDITGNVNAYRSNAMRCLCRVTDASMLPQIERYFKQCIVDKDPCVASAALVSAAHLAPKAGEIIKRWINEVQEALNSRNPMTQYHAVGVLYAIKQKDRLAVAKLMATVSSIRSPFAHTLLVKIAKRAILEDGRDSQTSRQMIDYLSGALKNSSDMVVLEAARAICDMPLICSKELSSAVSSLQFFLNSSKSVLRFAAVKTLNALATTHALLVSVCNLDLENLISDPNKNISTLAISCLLKTGSESSVERLMKQIYTFVSDVSDDFKIQIIEALKTLCLKFPQKYRVLIPFFSFMLREDGGISFKKAAVDSILNIMDAVPESKEMGLTHLCEFIEDCEYTALATRILYVLSQEGPKTTSAAKYIRYIYNRTALENATVRAAAVTALARFGTQVPSLCSQVILLLKRCLTDGDDEVRDRAVFYLSVLQGCSKDEVMQFVSPTIDVPLESLEESLKAYLLAGNTEEEFSFEGVSKEPPKAAHEHEEEVTEEDSPFAKVAMDEAAAEHPVSLDESAKLIASVPELATLGELWSVSSPVALTEKETEYVVSAVKYCFADYVAIQFKVLNTIPDIVLENVSVDLECEGTEFAPAGIAVPIDTLACGEEKSCFVVVKPAATPSDGELPPLSSIPATLRFVMKEGEEDEGNDDEYPLEAVDISISDYIRSAPISDWPSQWESMSDAAQSVQTYNLTDAKTIPDAIVEVTHFLGMGACDASEKASTSEKRHILYLSGTFRGGVAVLARIRIKTVERGTAVEVTVRAADGAVADAVAGAL